MTQAFAHRPTQTVTFLGVTFTRGLDGPGCTDSARTTWNRKGLRRDRQGDRKSWHAVCFTSFRTSRASSPRPAPHNPKAYLPHYSTKAGSFPQLPASSLFPTRLDRCRGSGYHHNPARTARESPLAAKKTAPETPDALLASLDHPLKAGIDAVRRIILEADPSISEGVKRNVPSFRTSEWFATVHLRATDRVQVILHLGEGPRAGSGVVVDDPGSLLEWLEGQGVGEVHGRGGRGGEACRVRGADPPLDQARLAHGGVAMADQRGATPGTHPGHG